MYMSVPGSRGSDDRILIGGLIAAVLVLVVIGGWLMINSPRDDRVSSADHAQTASVRFLGMTERNGLAELRLEERGQEITLSLSSANPIVTQARTLKPGAWFQVPRSQVPLTDDNSKPIKPSETP